MTTEQTAKLKEIRIGAGNLKSDGYGTGVPTSDVLFLLDLLTNDYIPKDKVREEYQHLWGEAEKNREYHYQQFCTDDQDAEVSRFHKQKMTIYLAQRNRINFSAQALGITLEGTKV